MVHDPTVRLLHVGISSLGNVSHKTDVRRVAGLWVPNGDYRRLLDIWPNHLGDGHLHGIGHGFYAAIDVCPLSASLRSASAC